MDLPSVPLSTTGLPVKQRRITVGLPSFRAPRDHNSRSFDAVRWIFRITMNFTYNTYLGQSGFVGPGTVTYSSEPSPQTMIISTRTLRRKRQKSGESSASVSSIGSSSSFIPSPHRRLGQGGNQFLHAVLSKTTPLSRGDQVTLGFLRHSPVYLSSRLAELNNIGENPVMVSVRMSNHTLAIELLLAIPDVMLRRSILTHVLPDGSNVLHVAAASGNLDFLVNFQLFWGSWGLILGDVSHFLMSVDLNGRTPKDIAKHQEGDREAVIVTMERLEAFHLLGEN